MRIFGRVDIQTLLQLYADLQLLMLLILLIQLCVQLESVYLTS